MGSENKKIEKYESEILEIVTFFLEKNSEPAETSKIKNNSIKPNNNSNQLERVEK